MNTHKRRTQCAGSVRNTSGRKRLARVTRLAAIAGTIVTFGAHAASAQQQTAQPIHLRPDGAAVMIGSIALVLALVTFCLYKIMSEKSPSSHHHAPLDIDTLDEGT